MPKYIQKFIDTWALHQFSSGGTTGPDYVQFQKEYRTVLKKVSKEAGCELHSFNKNHYEFSAVFKFTGDRFVYISISDVRFFPGQWYSHILYRTMTHDKDWTGGSNHYSDLEDLAASISMLIA